MSGGAAAPVGWGRGLVTLLAVLCVLGATRVQVPDLPPGLLMPGSILELFGGGDVVMVELSVVALGLGPYLSASTLVALAGFVVPSWRRAEEEGRASPSTRRRIATTLGGVFSVLLAWSHARLLSEAHGGEPSSLHVITLMGGSALLMAIAYVVTRHGMGGGVVTVHAAYLLAGIGEPIASEVAVLTVLSVGVSTALCVWSVTWGGRARVRAEPSAALVPAVPEPVGGLYLPLLALTALGLGSLAGLAGGEAPWLDRLPGVGARPWLAALVLAAGAGALTLGFAYVVAWPARLAALWSRVERAARTEDVAYALRAEVRDAAVRSAMLSAAVTAVLLGLQPESAAGSLTLAVFGATAILELRDDLRRPPDLVAVDEDGRAWASLAKREALRRAGVEATTRGAPLETLLPFVGPIAPVVVLVRRSDAGRARRILRGLDAATASPEGGAAPVRVERPEARGTVVFAVLAIALLGGPAVGAWRSGASPAAQEDLAASPTTLELRFIDDETNLLEDPSVVGVLDERVVVRREAVGRSRSVPYLALPGLTGADPDVRRRIAEQLGPHLPGDRVLAWGPERQDDDEPVAGLRSYLLAGELILDQSHVAHAVASEDEGGRPFVALELTADGADRFAEATSRWIGRRIAIVVDGVVVSAPLIHSEIVGGRAQITMSHGSLDQQRREAHDLARDLRAGQRRGR